MKARSKGLRSKSEAMCTIIKGTLYPVFTVFSAWVEVDGDLMMSVRGLCAVFGGAGRLKLKLNRVNV